MTDFSSTRLFGTGRGSWATGILLAAAAFLVGLGGSALADDPVVNVSNPYGAVDWETYGTYKGNFHTHTTQSDGNQTPAEVIDEYHNQGYHVLAITDHHNQVPPEYPTTYPWEDFYPSPEDPDPAAVAALDMVAVEGNELSSGDHIVSLFTGYTSGNSDVGVRLTGVGEAGGIAYLAHPGRYRRSAEWYADQFLTHPHCFGIEIYNQGDRYPGDRAMWDAVLSLTMPGRPVWGVSADDSHRASHIGRNRTYMLMPSLSAENVRASLESGRFYATYSTSASHTPPALTGVDIDNVAGTITVSGTGYTQVQWISMGAQVATGETIDLVNAPGVDRYVRAILIGSEGRTYTNPFGVEFFVNRPPAVSAGPDRMVQVGAVVTLEGSVTDDGLPDPPGAVTILWEKISGEGTVTFGDLAAAQTTATFSEVGTYELRLTADDGEFSTDDEVTITVVARLPDWTAYNDVSHGSGQLTHNITTFGRNQSGQMIDYATGTPLGVMLEIIDNPAAPTNSGGTGGPMPDPGTDAYDTFNGIVSFSNVIWYGPTGWWVDAVFTGLNPDHRYEFATSVNRGRSDYTNRWSKFTISDIDEATEASTPGVEVFSDTSVAFCSGNNTTNGHVARWTGIAPGANGSFTVRVEAGNAPGMDARLGYAFDGILLRDLGPAEEPDLDPPEIVELSPAPNATGVSVATQLVIVFDEDVEKGEGDIVVRNMDDSAFATIDVADANVSVAGAAVTVTLPEFLGPETEYYVEVDEGAIEDLAGNPFAGISDSETWSFTTGELDITPPMPDPMSFAVAPHAASPTTISMTATTATDDSPPVSYFFENVTLDTNSGWILETEWTDTGLTAGVSYSYRVKARDAVDNETAWSPESSVTIPIFVDFAVASASGPESASPVTVTVTLSATHSETITVEHRLATPGGTATPGVDFVYTPGELTFAPGQTSRDFTFEVIDDDEAKPDLTVVLELGQILNATVGEITTFTYTIEADEGDWFTVPFRDDFEARDVEELDGQFGWVAGNAVVQTEVAFGGSDRAVAFTGAGGFIRRTFNDEQKAVWTDLQVKVEPFPEGEAPVPEAGTTAYVYVNADFEVMAFDGTEAVGTGRFVEEDAWVRFTFFNDYNASTWDLYVDGIFVDSYDFYDAETSSYTEMQVNGGPSTYVDDVAVTLTMPDLGCVYLLTVNNGTGGGEYTAGTVVEIVAGAAPEGQEFDAWTGDTIHVDDVNSATTTVTMPAEAIAVTATYRDIPAEDPYVAWAGEAAFGDDDSEDGDGIPNGVAWVLGADNPTANVREAGLLPTLAVHEENEDLLVFTFRRRKAAEADENTEIAVVYSTDLTDSNGWAVAEDAPADGIVIGAADDEDPDFEIVTVTFDTSAVELGIDGRLFVRLRVERTAP